MENIFYRHSDPGYQIAANFSHMPWQPVQNFVAITSLYLGYKQKGDFPTIWIMLEKSLVKQVSSYPTA